MSLKLNRTHNFQIRFKVLFGLGFVLLPLQFLYGQDKSISVFFTSEGSKLIWFSSNRENTPIGTKSTVVGTQAQLPPPTSGAATTTVLNIVDLKTGRAAQESYSVGTTVINVSDQDFQAVSSAHLSGLPGEGEVSYQTPLGNLTSKVSADGSADLPLILSGSQKLMYSSSDQTSENFTAEVPLPDSNETTVQIKASKVSGSSMTSFVLAIVIILGGLTYFSNYRLRQKRKRYLTTE